MTFFTRTLTGLSNQYLFNGVDAIVYVEGGLSLSNEEIEQGKYGTESFDILFWQNMFSEFLPAKKFQFRCIGSKIYLMQLSETIMKGKVKNIYVAMDRDHDSAKGILKKGKGIFSTFGYSWENDVWKPEIVEKIFFTLCTTCRSNIDVTTDIEEVFDNFKKTMKRAVFIDILLSFDNVSLIPRSNPQILLNEMKNKPRIMKERIICQMREVRTKIPKGKKFDKSVKFSTVDDCFGHLVSIFCYRLLVFLFNKFSKGLKVSKEIANAVAIDKFFEKFKAKDYPQIYNHYEKQFSRLNI